MADLSNFNPWWQTGRVPETLVGRKRRILAEILEHVDVRQILILSGVRRAGKTTLMYQVVDELLRNKNTNPYEILYFSFDEAVSDIEKILKDYEKTVLKRSLSEAQRVYLLLDEIQKLPGWPEKIKIVYDLNPNVKMILSGSASIDIRKGTRESLAGRFFDFLIGPLDFDEYLDFTNAQVDKEREDIFAMQIRRSLDNFLQTGGFIEALRFDAAQRQKYFKESLLERVIFRDLPGVFAIRAPDLLFQLVRIVADRPGLYADYKNLANDLDYDQRTISEYFSYLEKAMLVLKLYNYSPNRLTSEKKVKRVYLSSTAFTCALSEQVDLPTLIEQFFVISLQAQFFWRTPQKDEVDLVHTRDKEVVPVEIKIRGDIRKRDVAPLFKFMARYKIRRGYMVSDDLETSFSSDSGTVRVVPYWKYWTLRKLLG